MPESGTSNRLSLALGFVALAYFASWLELRISHGVDWWRGAPNQLSLAGAWYYVVARPLVLTSASALGIDISDVRLAMAQGPMACPSK